MDYEFKSDKFSGPLSKLLELIEEKKLEITVINLGEVTADFLKYFSALEEAAQRQHRFLADFIAIASRLILIKSKALLPNLELTSDEEAEIKDLEERLKIYREFALAKVNLRKLYLQDHQSFERKYLPPAIFYPPKSLNLGDLQSALAKLAGELQLTSTTESANITLLNFEAKLKELARRIKKELKASFKQITKDKTKEEIVILFLAVLHLLKDNLIRFKQDKQFSDILIMANKDGQ